MVRFVQLPSPVPEEWPAAILDTIRSGAPLFWLGQPDASLTRLQALGLDISRQTSEGVPDGAIVLVPTPGRTPLDDLVWVVDRLLGPGGCPWDQEQTHQSLKRHLLEEAYEVLEAIDAEDTGKMCEELGDLLMQPVMHAQMQKRDGGFDTNDVARGIVEKLIRRHPHVFGTVDVQSADEVLKNWDAIKQTEKGPSRESLLAGVPKAMAALLRAHEISKRAARVGFEWPDIEAVFDKMHEEEAELRASLATGNPQEIADEIGDLLFTVVNIARWAKTDPEDALRRMLDRFTARFQYMEEHAPLALDQLDPEAWDALWTASKAHLGRQ